MTVTTLVESQPGLIDLSRDEADALRAEGRRLASDKAWWGIREDDGDTKRSVIDVTLLEGNTYNIVVRDAVGVIGLGTENQIHIQPKIPQTHLIYLLERGGFLPRTSSAEATSETDPQLWRLLIRWYLNNVEHVLRRDLMKGYQHERHTLRVVRGRINVAATTRHHYAGRLEYPCEFDEFTTDIAINRVLRAATRIIAASPVATRIDRRRATAVMSRMAGISDLQPQDLRTTTDRTTAHYADALALGKQVIRGHGRSLSVGQSKVWTFLIRTPDPVEAGILAILKSGLAPHHTVNKRGRQVSGTSLTFNPDLVFDHGHATGDVKYKVTKGNIRRPDLYQAIAFATLYDASNALIVGFDSGANLTPNPIDVGPLTITHIDWDASLERVPSDSAAALVQDIGEWLESEHSRLVRAG